MNKKFGGKVMIISTKVLETDLLLWHPFWASRSDQEFAAGGHETTTQRTKRGRRMNDRRNFSDAHFFFNKSFRFSSPLHSYNDESRHVTFSRNFGAVTQVVVGGSVGSLWAKNQHFPHKLPTYSPQKINILPTTTFDQQRPHKLSYDCPHLHKSTSCYPQQNQHFVNGPINYQLTPFLCHFSSGENAGNMLRWAGCWANVDVTRPPKNLSSA